jgi:PKD repeat protein
MGYASFSSDTTFGRTVLDFNEDPPYIYREDRELNFYGTIASYCDSVGNLLFYTNGIQIMGKDHERIENGDSINTGYYASLDYLSGYKVPESALFLQMPGHPDTILLFHGSTEPDSIFGITVTTFHETKIFNGQNTLVVKKNWPILENVALDGISAVKHANGRDWWVNYSVQSQNKCFQLLITDRGISAIEEVELSPEYPFLYASAYSRFSPDGKKFIRYYVSDGVYISDFDRCNGSFSNTHFIPVPEDYIGWGHCISPNSRYLYIDSKIEIMQIDLWSDDIESSIKTVALYDGYQSPLPTTFFLMQLGPGGRIYVNSTNGVNTLHAIQYPNKEGIACEVRQHSVQLSTYNAFTMPHFPNYRLGPLDGSPCDTLGLDNLPVAKFRYEQDTLDYLQVEFTDLSYYEPAEWSWFFGDNTTSQDTSPVHVFPQAGTYEVCLTVSNVNGEHTFCRTLSLGTVSSSEEAEQVTITVFPNPCREGVNILLNDYLPRDAKVMLYDAIGQRQKVQSVQTGWNTVRLDGLPTGIYFYEIWEGASPGPASGRVLLDSGKLVKVE